MYIYELSAIVLYFIILLGVGLLSYKKHISATDFIIGGRSLNYWLTALAAHASDMSSWLFMGYPAIIFTGGMANSWAAIGLIVFMYLNWQLIAPRVRVATEQYNSLTFSSFFESRFADTSGLIRVFTAIMSLVFYSIYISAALVGLGLLLQTLFGVPFAVGILIGTIIVVPYVFMGGYHTLAWIDLFQGIFLMLVIIAVPLYILHYIGGWDVVKAGIEMKKLSLSFLPKTSHPILETIFITMGWGIGYFGQPHIITKFMGIRNVHEIPKSKYIGMSWMTLSLGAATLVGLVGIAYFKTPLHDPEQVFIEMVREIFHPFLIGFILCAILAATINAMSSQVLVLSSTITEDFYKRFAHVKASSKELLIVSRVGVIVVAIVAFLIAYFSSRSIYALVLYAWSGLGSSFGPLLLLSLYSKKINKYGAWAGIVFGGLIAGVWPYLNIRVFDLPSPPSLIPGFFGSLILILVVSYFTQHIAKERGSI